MVLRRTAPPLLSLLPLLLLLLCAATSVTRGAILNDFIRHYEPVEYDASELHAQHRRVRRSTEYSPDVRLRFHASNRDFRLRLQPDRAVFSPDVVFESDSGPVKFDTNSVYTGVLEGDENAVVHGVISSDGLFDGSVVTASDHYYIEPSQRYFSEQQPFHSLVYRLSDVEHPEQPGRGCASHSLAEHNRTGSDVTVTSEEEEEVDEWLGHEQLYENVNGSAAEAADGGSSGVEGGGRRRRAIVNNKKTTCTMYLQADHLFYDQFGSEEACIEAMIRHVQQANEIYKAIDFNSDGVQDNIGFMIKRVRVHKPSAVNDVGYRFPGNYGVEKFLEKFSEENYDSFCLAYMFTYRDFEGGTLGLAWTGDLNQAGGVCEKNGHYRGSKKSLNSGIISILNYGKRVPPAVSHVTFAHEVGHNFGSQHDPDNNKDCTPGGVDGNYIMYARATSGDKRNNNRFSPCSLRSINPVLRVKARSTHGCFVEPQAAICGNGVVEDGEECDCGWEEDCKEACCNPMSATPPTGRPPCQLRAGARCSPSQGPCCNDTCEFGYGQECRDNNGCRAKARCNGRSADCPPSIQRPDRTICDEGNVCFKGECSGSICLAYGLESCQCEQEHGANDTKSCELCCKRPGVDQPCISTFEWNSKPFDIPDQFSKPGTPCKQYTGYCDVFQMCREVDPIGPLATLKNLFLSDKSLSVVKEFMDRYWYMIVLCLVIVILSLIAVIRIFGKTPPKYHRRHRRRNSATKKRPRDADVESPPLPDVTAGAEVAPPTTEPADTEQTTSERGRPQLKRRVEDVRRAAAKARRAASHMALSSRASVASGVARVTRRGKREQSRPSGDEQRKRRRKDQSKSRGGHRRPREQTKDGVKVISYSNIPADLGVTETKTEPRLTGLTAKSAEAAAVGDVDKRKSLPAAVARRKPTASADAEKRRSLPKPPGSPQKPARHESPNKQRRSTADVPARDQERERGRRQTKDAEQSLARSSSQRQRSSKREDKKKRSRSISPTKRPARDSRPTAKPADDNKADKKKRFGLKHVASADNVISDWLGRNAKKDAHKHKHAERNRKKPIVPTAPMHPNDQVLQWLRTASSEPSGVDVADGMVSPKPTRRVSLSSSQTSGSLQRAPGRPGFGRVTSCEESSLASRQQSASPARDTASSLGAASRRRGASQSELSGGGSASRPAYNRSRSQPAPSEERLSFQAVPESVYDLPRGASPERIYDLPSGATPERELPLEPPRPAEPTRPPPAEPTRPPPAMDRQMSVPAFQQQRAPRSGSPSRRPPERNVSVPAGLHSRSPGRQATGSDRTSAPAGHPQKTRRTASPSRYSSSERPGSVPSSRRPNSTVSYHSPDRPLPSPPTERQVAAPEEREVAAPEEAAEDTSDEFPGHTD